MPLYAPVSSGSSVRVARLNADQAGITTMATVTGLSTLTLEASAVYVVEAVFHVWSANQHATFFFSLPSPAVMTNGSCLGESTAFSGTTRLEFALDATYWTNRAASAGGNTHQITGIISGLTGAGTLTVQAARVNTASALTVAANSYVRLTKI